MFFNFYITFRYNWVKSMKILISKTIKFRKEGEIYGKKKKLY